MQIKKTKHLIDAITSYNGYRLNNDEIIDTHLLTFIPISKGAINDGHIPYRDSVGNRVLVHLRVLLYPLGVGLSLN